MALYKNPQKSLMFSSRPQSAHFPFLFGHVELANVSNGPSWVGQLGGGGVGGEMAIFCQTRPVGDAFEKNLALDH